MTDLSKLDALYSAATDGPWELSGSHIWVPDVEYGMEAGCCGQFNRDGSCCGNAIPVQVEEQVQREVARAEDKDAALIVALVNEYPALRAGMQALREAVRAALNAIEADENQIRGFMDPEHCSRAECEMGRIILDVIKPLLVTALNKGEGDND